MVSIWKKIFSSPSPQKNNGVLLVEQVDSNISLHLLCVYAYIITSAKNLTPVFITDEFNRMGLQSKLERYFEQVQLIDKPKLSLMTKMHLLFVATYKWGLLLARRNVITLTWRGSLIGDIVYDQYLASCQRGTLYYADIRLLKIIFYVIHSIEVTRKLMLDVKPKGALRSHQVGLTSAPIAVVCEEFGVPIYSIGGAMYGTLICSNKRKDYFYTATLDELKPLLDLSDKKFNNCFEGVKKELFQGSFNSDSKLAFANKLYDKRIDFADAFGLDVKKKNIFIMLHAFTDYPHSHFNGMLFNDYMDWFLKTLAYISNLKTVNWIIKHHPSSYLYPVEDVNWDELKRKYVSDNLIFMEEGVDFDSRSICHVGDAIVTCLGSAGFEYSALGGVPSVAAGDNPYVGAGFAVYPNNIKEYYNTLTNISTFERLTGKKLRLAKATFMFIHRFSRVSMNAVASLSHQEQRVYQYNDSYFDVAEENAKKHQSQIVAELEEYVNDVSQPDFYALRTKPLN